MSAQNFCLKKMNLDLSAKTFQSSINNGCGKSPYFQYILHCQELQQWTNL